MLLVPYAAAGRLHSRARDRAGPTDHRYSWIHSSWAPLQRQRWRGMTDTLHRLGLITAPVEHQIADYIASLLGPDRPRRISKMTRSGSAKYFDIAGPFTRQMLINHAGGRETYAATLDQGGKARAGAIDIDQGGQAAVMAVLAATTKR